MTPTLSPVTPARPVAAYVGGKKNLSRRICGLIEATPHDLYAEPFVGMGGVFLRRASRPRTEIVNDFSQDVATFYRVLQRHYVAFLDMLRFQITSRAEFERLCLVDPATLTDLERAARFLYLQRTAFGGKVVGRNFAMEKHGRGGRFDVSKLQPMLEDLQDRMSGVIIERLDFATFIARYDSPGALFYCDPPYFGTEGYYGEDLFTRPDFERLASALQSTKGRFILSINDAPEIRDLFAWATIEPVTLKYTVSQGSTDASELIITSPAVAGTLGHSCKTPTSSRSVSPNDR